MEGGDWGGALWPTLTDDFHMRRLSGFPIQPAHVAQLPLNNAIARNSPTVYGGGAVGTTGQNVGQLVEDNVAGDARQGQGVLTWLSSKAGLIKSDKDSVTVSFQLKDFCDQGVTDLTAVLRPGFTLSFQALSTGGEQYIATCEGIGDEVDVEAAASLDSGPPQLNKEVYCVQLEMRAIPMLLSIFQRMATPTCQLSSLHCQISNCGDEELYRYVGTSSLKRRQFVERRTHIFAIGPGDTVSLQPAALHDALLLLAGRLLRQGGAAPTHSLYSFFCSCPDIPLEAREIIAQGENGFMALLLAHSWIFAVFPSRVFVSARRNLPSFDYSSFLNEHFSDCDLRQFVPPSTGLATASRSMPPAHWIQPAASPQPPRPLLADRVWPPAASFWPPSFTPTTSNSMTGLRRSDASTQTCPSTEDRGCGPSDPPIRVIDARPPRMDDGQFDPFFCPVFGLDLAAQMIGSRLPLSPPPP